IKKGLKRASRRSDIRGGFVIKNNVLHEKTNSVLSISGVRFDVKKIIYTQFRKAESVAFFICTAGNNIGDYAQELMQKGDMMEGYIMDVIGSEMVEAAIDKMQEELEQIVLSEGLQITNRYSPGYCGWSVSEQQKLFSLLPEKFCGVSLTASSLMQPVKTVSGIIGIGTEVQKKGYACRVCEIDNCIYRKKIALQKQV
ncbi:MAG TPA: vitamin B12 dependent-methionine synthase activation domain-containing protein, partial [Chitinophagaceae bacterium]|nr:vitamin B12 dependent-methionine synthase activation domain-containing protein [Chitinophagaceae bacterium]